MNAAENSKNMMGGGIIIAISKQGVTLMEALFIHMN